MEIAPMQEPFYNVGQWPFEGMSIMGLNRMYITLNSAYTQMLSVQYTKEHLFKQC